MLLGEWEGGILVFLLCIPGKYLILLLFVLVIPLLHLINIVVQYYQKHSKYLYALNLNYFVHCIHTGYIHECLVLLSFFYIVVVSMNLVYGTGHLGASCCLGTEKKDCLCSRERYKWL